MFGASYRMKNNGMKNLPWRRCFFFTSGKVDIWGTPEKFYLQLGIFVFICVFFWGSLSAFPFFKAQYVVESPTVNGAFLEFAFFLVINLEHVFGQQNNQIYGPRPCFSEIWPIFSQKRHQNHLRWGLMIFGAILLT